MKTRTLNRRDGTTVGSIGDEDRMAGMFYYIDGIAADSHGNIYTGEVQTGKRIQKFVPVKPYPKPLTFVVGTVTRQLFPQPGVRRERFAARTVCGVSGWCLMVTPPIPSQNSTSWMHAAKEVCCLTPSRNHPKMRSLTALTKRVLKDAGPPQAAARCVLVLCLIAVFPAAGCTGTSASASGIAG